MTCKPCTIVFQLLLNALLILDLALNTLLGGSPYETLSRRMGRAALLGHRCAIAFCWVLNQINKDHCTWSMDRGSIGREVFPFSANAGYDGDGVPIPLRPDAAGKPE